MAMFSVKKFTLVMLRKGNSFLLGLKKRGFGVGKWNGFGGKIQENETIEAAANRELEEECGLLCQDLSKFAVITFEFENEPVKMEVHVFKGTKTTGCITESEEMQPRWFDLDDIPYENMWPDDAYWWPYMLENKKFRAYFLYQREQTIINYKIDEVSDV